MNDLEAAKISASTSCVAEKFRHMNEIYDNSISFVW